MNNALQVGVLLVSFTIAGPNVASFSAASAFNSVLWCFFEPAGDSVYYCRVLGLGLG